VLRVKERITTLFSSDVSIFGLAFESFKECGSASLGYITIGYLWLFYWWLLLAILLMTISAYVINA
jgi:hypothetical protein